MSAHETIPATADPDDHYIDAADAAAREVDGAPTVPEPSERAKLLQAIAHCQTRIKISANNIRDANGEMQLLFARLGTLP